ncbi:glycerol dehydrogenase [Enterococcus sp. BWM-S5]|uniref:Glycerol dehydrogenase n=1 Tax=Enterococcus larvae TaxID=2794352 RepID=A0ABS4CM55_9ENTE|nr:glycerol dehydrogenase [Enterococcus larvae]MBP1047669.1 glycerol dehydrogenase [Enterococcus larvae]
MEKLFISPSKYVQGEHVLQQSAEYLKELGSKLLLLTDSFVWDMLGKDYEEYLKAAGLEVESAIFSGEVSPEAISQLSKDIEANSIEVLAALGGGKIIDIGKAIAAKLKLKIAILPTTASTDAPTSSVSVFYEADGRFRNYEFYQRNPDLVLVDTAVVVNAPARLLAAGIADGLSTAIEARAVWKKQGANILGKAPTLTALAIAEKCEEILFSYGLQAMEDNRNKTVTPAFDAVVEANTLMSGLGFESGGLAAAHALHNGFSAIHGKADQLMHGEKVAFTTLVQLVLEKQSEEMLKRYITLFRELGLPTTCEDMGIDTKDEEQLLTIARQSMVKGDSLQQMPMKLSEEDIIEGIRELDRFVLVNYS